MVQNGKENNGNRSDRQMALVSSQLLKQMFFSAGYSISLFPGTLKRKYKDSLGIVEMQHIYCAKDMALYPHPVPPTITHLRRQIFGAVVWSTLNLQAYDF